MNKVRSFSEPFIQPHLNKYSQKLEQQLMQLSTKVAELNAKIKNLNRKLNPNSSGRSQQMTLANPNLEKRRLNRNYPPVELFLKNVLPKENGRLIRNPSA